MRFKLLFCLLIGVFLIGCSSESNFAYDYAPKPTPTPMPTLTPVATSVANEKGLKEGTLNTKFVLKGANFENFSSVELVNELGSFPTKIVSQDSDTIEFVIPNTIVVEQNYSVFVFNGEEISSEQNENCIINIVSPQLPQLTSLDKCAGPTSETALVINGKNFREKGNVFFNGTDEEIKADVTEWTEDKLTVTIPSNLTPSKSYDIYVETVAGRNINCLNYTPFNNTEKYIGSVRELRPSYYDASVEFNLLGATPHPDPTPTPLPIDISLYDGSTFNVVSHLYNGVRALAYFAKNVFRNIGGSYASISSDSLSNEAKVYFSEKPREIYGLFIGISDYKTLNSLTYPDKDAADMQSALTGSSRDLWSAGVTKFNKIIIDSEATKANILSEINNMKTAIEAGTTEPDANKMVFIYYSGHGGNAGGKAYMCPYDMNVEDFNTGISDTELLALLNEFPTEVRKIVIMDSCHSGGFIGKAPNSLIVKSTSLSGSVKDFKGKGFKQLASVPNLIFGSAARGDQLSYDAPFLNNGMFTYYLLEAIGRDKDTLGAAKSPNAKNINIEKALWYTQVKAAKASSSGEFSIEDRQDAQVLSNYKSGDMPLKGDWDI